MKIQESIPRRQRALTGRRFFNILLGFFGFIIVINGIFVYFAFDSWPGLGTQDSYRKGLAYNETLEAAERQQALGWQSAISLKGAAHKAGVVQVRLKDAQDVGLVGLDVSVSLARPAREGFDQSIKLEHLGGGLYQTLLTVPFPGRWYATIKAEVKENVRYRMTHEVMVK